MINDRVLDRTWIYNLLTTGRALCTLSCRETYGRARDLVQGLKKGFLAGQVTFKSYLPNEHGVQASWDPLAKSLIKKSKKCAQESRRWELKFNFDLSPASFRMNSVIKCPYYIVVTVHFAVHHYKNLAAAFVKVSIHLLSFDYLNLEREIKYMYSLEKVCKKSWILNQPNPTY